MEQENRILLDKVIKNRLENALKADSEEAKQAFKEAMDAVGKQIEFDRIDVAHEEQLAKMRMEEDKNLRDEAANEEKLRKDRYVQIGIFAAGLIATPIIEVVTKTIYANKICRLEQFETFTTSAGRGISSWFRFKK